MGMAVRIWLHEQKKWADHWTSADNGVVNAPQLGVFIDDEGVFISEEEVDGVKWQYRGVWDKVSSKSCRWHQSASSDGGKNWEWNWWNGPDGRNDFDFQICIWKFHHRINAVALIL